jgi:hypothetical protein
MLRNFDPVLVFYSVFSSSEPFKGAGRLYGFALEISFLHMDDISQRVIFLSA